jgi:phage gpG-like protein
MADALVIKIETGPFFEALNYAVERLEKPGDLMAVIGATLEQNANQRFSSKTDPSGVPWAPLLESTLKRKAGAGSLLQLSGLGKSSLTSNVGGEGRSVEVGFGERYMGYHETGTKRMPRRGLLSADADAGRLGQQDEIDVLTNIEEYLATLGL